MSKHDLAFLDTTVLETFHSFFGEEKEDVKTDYRLTEHDNFVEIRLSGSIGCWLSYEDFKETISLAVENGAKNILLCLDSPGGSVLETQGIIDLINEYKKDGISFVTYASRYLCSGGYYIASYTNKIYCSPVCLTASIGAYATIQTLKGYYERMGISKQVFASGKKKYFPDETRNLTDEEKQEIQADVDKSATKFINDVAINRALSPESIRALEGGALESKEALAEGLIDEVMDKEQMLENLAEKVFNANMIQIDNENNPANEVMTKEKEKDLQVQTEIENVSQVSAERDSMSAEIKEMKDSLINDFSVKFKKATGKDASPAKVKVLGAMPLSDIKAELEDLNTLTKKRYQIEEPVKESSFTNQEVAKDVSPSQKSGLETSWVSAFVSGSGFSNNYGSESTEESVKARMRVNAELKNSRGGVA